MCGSGGKSAILGSATLQLFLLRYSLVAIPVRWHDQYLRL